MRALPISGGGCLGCGPVALMKQVKATMNIPDEDVNIGTSVGGLISACRAIGMTWEHTHDVFRTYVHQIFDAPMTWKLDPWYPKYSDAGIKSAVTTIFGNRKMSDTVRPLFITTYDVVNGKPKIYDSTDNDLISDVVRQSAAAPTYFPPFNNQFIDGGVWANNPSVIGIIGMMSKLHVELKDIKMLSLGTSGDYWADPHISRQMLEMSWLKPILNIYGRGLEQAAVFTATTLLRSNYTNILPHLYRDFELDDLESMDEFERIWLGQQSIYTSQIEAWAS